MNITTLLNQIKNGEIVLPAIQRDFVWDKLRITSLLDSIMRGYPVGIVLLWETYNEISYRRFVSDYQPEGKHAFHENRKRGKMKVVLDGQQRLQSLYVALYGSYDDQFLFFDVLSGIPSDDYSDEQFIFHFAEEKDAKRWNAESKEQTALPPEDRPGWYTLEHYISVTSLFAMGVEERVRFRKNLVKEYGLNEADETRVESNLARFDEALLKNENLLKASVIDENLVPGNPGRKTEADVLEIFVRINRQGTALSRSDLIFSILKLRWKESAQALPEFVRQIRKGNSFDLNTDFVIRCLFAVSDLGTKFNLDLLRTKSKVDLMRDNFGRCCNAIKSAIDFAVHECRCQSSDVIGGDATLIPFVYYLFHHPKLHFPNSQIEDARKSFYLLAFSQPFSRYADSRLGAFLRNELRPLREDANESFPFERVVAWIGHWERIQGFNTTLLQSNPALALHLIQGRSGAKTHYGNNAPELDHIFPRSILRQKGVDQTKIEHLANLWILAKGKNGNKSNRRPSDYFSDVPARDMKRALIDRKLLDYKQYNRFLASRTALMLKYVSKETGIRESDFDTD